MVAPTAQPPRPPAETPAAGPGAPQSPGALPPLSLHDHTLLLRLLTLNEDFPALAAELASNRAIEVPALRDFDAPGSGSPSVSIPLSPAPSLLDLISWSTGPAIAAWLSHYHALQDQHSRRLAITELQSLLKTSDNPVEKRRTATTILRALDHKWPTEPRRVLVNPDRQGGARNPFAPRGAFAPPSPRYKRGEVSGGSATDGEGGCSPSRKPPTTATPALKSETSNFQLPSPPPPRPSAPSSLSTPSPSILPSPSLTPTDLATALAQDLFTGNLVQTAATLAAISTDSLRADPDTVIARLEPVLGLPASTPISPPAYHKPTPPSRHACRIKLSHAAHTLTLNFTRAHNAPWLLNSLDST